LDGQSGGELIKFKVKRSWRPEDDDVSGHAADEANC